jgi:hypothetical protein
MLNRKESYVEIWGEDRNRGIVYGQSQDDGTGRSIRRNFNVNGWEVNNMGEVVDPDYKSPEDIEKELSRIAANRELKEQAKDPGKSAMIWSDFNESEFLLADRLNIVNPSQPGFLEVEDIQVELKNIGVNYHWNAGREKLLNLLKEEMGAKSDVESGGSAGQ